MVNRYPEGHEHCGHVTHARGRRLGLNTVQQVREGAAAYHLGARDTLLSSELEAGS